MATEMCQRSGLLQSCCSATIRMLPSYTWSEMTYCQVCDPASRKGEVGEGKGKRKSRFLPFKGTNQELHRKFSLTSHWPEFSHMMTSECKRGWEMQTIFWGACRSLKIKVGLFVLTIEKGENRYYGTTSCLCHCSSAFLFNAYMRVRIAFAYLPLSHRKKPGEKRSDWNRWLHCQFNRTGFVI